MYRPNLDRRLGYLLQTFEHTPLRALRGVFECSGMDKAGIVVACSKCSRHEGFRTIPWGLLGGGLRQCTVPNPLPRHGCRRRHFPARHRHTPRLHFEIWTAYSVLSSCCFPKRDNLAIQSIIHEERVDLHIHESTVAFPFDRDESL